MAKELGITITVATLITSTTKSGVTQWMALDGITATYQPAKKAMARNRM